jgi:hypothetical protein
MTSSHKVAEVGNHVIFMGNFLMRSLLCAAIAADIDADSLLVALQWRWHGARTPQMHDR